MRIYCYWPFARAEDQLLFDALPGPDDHVVLDVIDRPDTPSSHPPTLQVRHGIPDVAPTGGTAAWVRDRAGVYLDRTRRRDRFVADLRPDVVHLGFLNRFADQRSIARLHARGPLVATIHDVRPHDNRLPAGLDARLADRLHRHTDVIIVHDDLVAHDLIEICGVDRERIHLVPLWITAHVPPSFERELHEVPTVLFQGSLRANKGIPTLLAAIDRLQGEELRFVIAGNGDAEQLARVEDAASRLPNLHAELGTISAERKVELLTTSDLAVLPYTEFRSQSGVLHDALGARLPVVVSDVGPLGRLVREWEVGTVVPPGDPVALAAAIHDAVSDEESWRKASAAGAVIAADRSPGRTGERYRAVYRDTIGVR